MKYEISQAKCHLESIIYVGRELVKLQYELKLKLNTLKRNKVSSKSQL